MEKQTLRRHRTTYEDKAFRTFRRAFESASEREEIKAGGRGFYRVNGDCGVREEPNANLSDIFSRLIRASGSVSVRYNSDIIIDIDIIKETLARYARLGENVMDIIVVGIRKDGADSTRAVLHDMIQNVDMMTGYVHVEHRYHTVFGIEIAVTVTEPAPNQNVRLEQPKFDVTLRDITNDIYRLDPHDITDETAGSELTYKKERLMGLRWPPRETAAFTEDELQEKLRGYYDAYQKYRLYTSGVTVAQVRDWLMQGHEDLAGMACEHGSKLDDFEAFKKHSLLSEEYMKEVLAGQRLFGEYLAVIDQLYR